MIRDEAKRRDEILRNLLNTPPDPKVKERKIIPGGKKKKAAKKAG